MLDAEKDIIALLSVSKLLAQSVRGCLWWRTQLEKQFGPFDTSIFPKTNWHQVYIQHMWGWRGYKNRKIIGNSVLLKSNIQGIPNMTRRGKGFLTDG